MSNVSCPNQEWYSYVGSKMFNISYFLVTPVCFALGIVAHSICSKAFYNEAKKEKGYLYQVYLAIGRSVQTFSMTLYIVGAYWLAYSTSPDTIWFRSSYWCMLLNIKVVSTLYATSVTLSQLFSILVGVDRVYALWKPHLYIPNYHMRNNKVIVFVLVLVAILVNLFNFFRFNVIQSSTAQPVYSIVPNNQFIYTVLGKIMYNSRTVTDTVGLVALYMCNGGMVWLYRLRMAEAKKSMNRNSQMKKRDEIERTLSLLAISQSVCSTVTVTHRTVFAAFVSFSPTFYVCQGSIHLPLLIAVFNIVDLVDFICVLAICKPFRRAIARVVCCRRHGNVTIEVTPVGAG